MRLRPRRQGRGDQYVPSLSVSSASSVANVEENEDVSAPSCAEGAPVGNNIGQQADAAETESGGLTCMADASREMRESALRLTNTLSEIKNAIQESVEKVSQVLMQGSNNRATFTNSVSQSTADVISITSGGHNTVTNRVASPEIIATETATTGKGPMPGTSHNPSTITPSGFSQIVYLREPSAPTFGNAPTHTFSPSKFIRELEKYFKKANIPPHQQLEVALDSLYGIAQNWSTLFVTKWQVYEDFRKAFLKHFFSEIEQEKIRREIYTGKWDNRRKMVDHFAYFVQRASLLTKPFKESELLDFLMRHFDVHTQSLWALQSEHTLDRAAEFLRSQQEIVDFSNLPPLLPLSPAKTARAPPFRTRPQTHRDQVVPQNDRVHQTYNMQRYEYPAQDERDDQQTDNTTFSVHTRHSGNL